MNLLKLFLIATLAFAIGACGGAATEQKKDDSKPGDEKTEKKDETKTEKTGKVADTPKAALENLFAAVQAKDEDGIRNTLSKETVEAFEMMAKEKKISFYDVLMDGGKDDMKKMPEIKDEKIDGDKATAEVKDPDDDTWTKINFVKEDGSWKMALVSKEEMEETMKAMDELKNLEKETKGDGKDDKPSTAPEGEKK